MANDSKPNDHPEVIQILSSAQPTGATWNPVIRSETTNLLRHLGLPDGARDVLREEARTILGKCVSPSSSKDTDTGLVIGYVQSGKTMSFTTVAALARDNDFRIVIVITGISVPLFDQSKRRLMRDLRIDTPRDRKWQLFTNPSPRGNTIQHIDGTLRAWEDGDVPPALRSTVLITVMKNRTHLDNLIEVLSGLNLERVPALIIDDEADQAGLNTLVRQGDSSATYRRLLAIRQLLPHHSFLQYTATPQAPLLINLIDILSPSFAEILTPGEEYVGGRYFFLERPELIRVIPNSEIPTKDAPLHEPPRSLMEAMRLFFLGVAAGYEEGDEGNRSMMVHPSPKIMQHVEYMAWVTAIKRQWERTLDLDESDPDRRQLLEDFQNSYEDLRRSVAHLPSFDSLTKLLRHSIHTTHVTQVNSVGSTVVDWRSTYPHILVGGQAMDRGFTVEGLTVTYMPRGVGVSQADTIQQRARFFGYKRRYIDYCRVFLEQRVVDAYRQYIHHEEDVRARLIQHRASGLSLAEWRRAFFLTRDLKPTRKNVLGLDYMQDRISDDWFYPSVPHYSRASVDLNRQVVNKFVHNLKLQPDPGHPSRTAAQIHAYNSEVPLRTAFEELLTRLSYSRPEDSQPFTGVLLQIQSYLEDNPDANCVVYIMSPNDTRKRELDKDDEIKNLFQGEYPVEASRRGSIYPGDRKICDPQRLTIQIHRLTVHKKNKVIERDVPTIAIWVPHVMGADWLVQNQGGSPS